MLTSKKKGTIDRSHHVCREGRSKKKVFHTKQQERAFNFGMANYLQPGHTPSLPVLDAHMSCTSWHELRRHEKVRSLVGLMLNTVQIVSR